MMVSHPRLQGLLLDLLGQKHLDPSQLLDRLEDAHWQTLLTMARQHRMEPMLHWQLRHRHNHVAVPVAIRTHLANCHKRSTLRSLRLQAELLRIHRLLEAAGIAHIALKGAFLAFFAYPQSGLRPMRDLDILVPVDCALRAFQLLLDAGLERMEATPGEPETWMLEHRHLPPLQTAQRIIIELHTSLYDPVNISGGHPVELTTDLWSRATQASIAGENIAYLSSSDLLLHLIVHSIYQHRLDNGPLVLSDVAYLLHKQTIDWPLFWVLAEKGGYRPGCLLLLKVAEADYPSLAIEWPATTSDDRMPSAVLIESTRLLILRDFESRNSTYLRRAIQGDKSLSGKIRLLARKLFPSRQQLFKQHGRSPGVLGLPGIYLRQWQWVLRQRLPQYLKSVCLPRLRSEISQLAELDKWLDGKHY
jgi:hypothetical protein